MSFTAVLLQCIPITKQNTSEPMRLIVWTVLSSCLFVNKDIYRHFATVS